MEGIVRDIRILTGKWYLKPKFFGGYDVMVQVKISVWDDPSYGNGGGSYSPEKTLYQKGTTEDLIELNIFNN